jgi:CRISPR-associated protein Cas1
MWMCILNGNLVTARRLTTENGYDMRKLLNTLYITIENGYLHKDGENIALKEGGETKFTMPIHNLEGIICIGNITVSSQLMGFCVERRVGLSFVSEYGKFQARATGKINGNVLVRKKMYTMADDEDTSIAVARHFILGKVNNCRAVLERGIRDHAENIDVATVETCSKYLRNRLVKIRAAGSNSALLGYEGECAKIYFEGLDHLILTDKNTFFIKSRSKRPPLDNMNAILSFIYTILAHDVQSALEAVGLDSYVGFYHKDRPGRASLALDMMEELRPFLADRLALTLVNRQQLKKGDFLQKESGAVLMKDDARKILLTAWQKRKKEEITHPFLREKIPLGLLPYVQAMLLSKYIRGELNGYPPFLWK